MPTNVLVTSRSLQASEPLRERRRAFFSIGGLGCEKGTEEGGGGGGSSRRRVSSASVQCGLALRSWSIADDRKPIDRLLLQVIHFPSTIQIDSSGHTRSLIAFSLIHLLCNDFKSCPVAENFYISLHWYFLCGMISQFVNILKKIINRVILRRNAFPVVKIRATSPYS